MSMHDPISDALTRIRNAAARHKDSVSIPCSKVKSAIMKVLQDEGYIEGYQIEENEGKKQIVVTLKYYNGEPVISHVRRVSKPSLRIYKKADELPKVLNGLGIAIVSTSQGIMSDRDARAKKEGGEILCIVE